jgi:hypothetical protein
MTEIDENTVHIPEPERAMPVCPTPHHWIPEGIRLLPRPGNQVSERILRMTPEGWDANPTWSRTTRLTADDAPVRCRRSASTDIWPTRCDRRYDPAASERIDCAALAVRNRPNGALLSFTHITAGPSHICEMLELCAAPGASGIVTGPLIHEGLPTDMDSPLGPRPKLRGGDPATDGVGGNRSECKAIVVNLRNL